MIRKRALLLAMLVCSLLPSQPLHAASPLAAANTVKQTSYSAESFQLSAGAGSMDGGSAGNQDVRTGDASNGIAPIFDANTVRDEVNAQVAITSTFGQQASKAVGDYAQKQLEEARKSGTAEDIARWEEGGSARLALHALVDHIAGLRTMHWHAPKAWAPIPRNRRTIWQQCKSRTLRITLNRTHCVQ